MRIQDLAQEYEKTKKELADWQNKERAGTGQERRGSGKPPGASGKSRSHIRNFIKSLNLGRT